MEPTKGCFLHIRMDTMLHNQFAKGVRILLIEPTISRGRILVSCPLVLAG